MPDGIAEWVPNLGAGSLLVLVIIMVLTGRLVPAKEMRYWREAFFEEQRQKQQLLNASRITQDVLRAIPGAIEEARNE